MINPSKVTDALAVAERYYKIALDSDERECVETMIEALKASLSDADLRDYEESLHAKRYPVISDLRPVNAEPKMRVDVRLVKPSRWMRFLRLIGIASCVAGCAQSSVDTGAYYDEISIDMAIDAWVADGGAYGETCEADRDELVVLALPPSSDECTFVDRCERVIYDGDPVLVVSSDPERRRETTMRAATEWLAECSAL